MFVLCCNNRNTRIKLIDVVLLNVYYLLRNWMDLCSDVIEIEDLTWLMDGKILWALTKSETWFDFFLALFMSGYKWDKRDLEESSFKVNQVFYQLIFDVVGKRTLGAHLYLLINKAKKKSNQVSNLISTHLTFPFSYALFMSWINETLRLDWCKTRRMVIVGVINWCKGNFIPSTFYINTLKVYMCSGTPQIYWIFNIPWFYWNLLLCN